MTLWNTEPIATSVRTPCHTRKMLRVLDKSSLMEFIFHLLSRSCKKKKDGTQARVKAKSRGHDARAAEQSLWGMEQGEQAWLPPYYSRRNTYSGRANQISWTSLASSGCRSTSPARRRARNRPRWCLCLTTGLLLTFAPT